MSPGIPSGWRPLALQVLRTLVIVLLAPWELWALEMHMCSWQISLIKFESLGRDTYSDFFHQSPVDTVGNMFSNLVNSPIDVTEKYLGFPYYLRINYTCMGDLSSQARIRKGLLTGLRPMVLITFKHPVNYRRWKIERVQIQMEAVPFRHKGACSAEVVCRMSWYTPMPVKNGSVVMTVDIGTNHIGPILLPQSFYMNINGYLKMESDGTLGFTVGNKIDNMKPQFFLNAPSRPLWYTVNHTPVLILGGIPNEKAILMSNTYFRDSTLVELNIDSCWVGSFYCPETRFTATIYDTIATESALFIRQNQLVYYFTGNYPILRMEPSKGTWVRILANECIKMLCPVEIQVNGSEHVIALTMGKHEGYIHFGTIKDGLVSFEMLPRGFSVCQEIKEINCSIVWAVYGTKSLLLLVEVREDANFKSYLVVSYTREGNLHGRQRMGLATSVQRFLVLSPTGDTESLSILYKIPELVPDAKGRQFLMILSVESYTDTPSVPRGLHYNPFSQLLYIWGNFIMESYDLENYIYLAEFPKESTIKYMVNSFLGDMAIVTENEEIWYIIEGSYKIYKLFPSDSWQMHFNLQKLQQSSVYTPKETMVTLFYEGRQLYQLVHLLKGSTSQLVKRPVPVDQLLIYQQFSNSYTFVQQGKDSIVSFTNLCSFSAIRLQDLPRSQRYTRQERYLALPPVVMGPLGFHTEESLAIYQGLIYYLLWLHSKYDKPYADPVHDPTWRWWKDKKQDQSYYFYLASNRQSSENVYIDMANYGKIYNLPVELLPERLYLDKGNTYSFSVFFIIKGHSFAYGTELGTSFYQTTHLSLGVLLANPECIEVIVTETMRVNRKSLYQVTIKDKSVCFEQAISGHSLVRTSIVLKVVGSVGHCFEETFMGPRMVGNLMMPILIGCPPGKRLAFDVTLTLSYTKKINKQHFDCLKVDPEMPCFHFRDVFYPFFLVQDLVTGESGSFEGDYILKVIGGGPTQDTIRDYSEREIYNYNSPLQEWLCLPKSPCYDMVPEGIFAPEYFFKVLVSNRGVDKSTYCDYQLIFLLHIHGIPLSPERYLHFLLVSASILLGLVIFYLIMCFLWPQMVKAYVNLRWKIHNIIASDSYYSYISGGTSVRQQPSKSSNRTEKSRGPSDRTLEKRVQT
ncbi:cation channel sperm-associated auxiliary subunit gamma [Tenrec ecaudatus]|uniref:cation channel sperm-associated auxiliary subunit gamma n=1 Tax=Tenrec ecaudatus TaxID=94439 RepID=UPI003F59BB62